MTYTFLRSRFSSRSVGVGFGDAIVRSMFLFSGGAMTVMLLYYSVVIAGSLMAAKSEVEFGRRVDVHDVEVHLRRKQQQYVYITSNDVYKNATFSSLIHPHLLAHPYPLSGVLSPGC